MSNPPNTAGNQFPEKKNTDRQSPDTERSIHGLTEALAEMKARLDQEIALRKNAEQALRDRERFFRLMLDATSDGVWDRNVVTGEVYYGENWARMLGYSAQEVREKRIRWDDLLHPDDKKKALAAIQDHFNGITSRYVAEFRMRNKAGAWQWVLARGKVVEWDETGRPLRFVGTHYDISDRKKVEEELHASSQKVKQFAYSVVHDLKNPAISIHGLAQKLKDRYGESLNQKGTAFCEQIVRSAEQIAALVDKINLFIAAREVPLFLQKVSLAETFAIIREEFSLSLELRRISWIAPEDLPDIIADRLSLLRVLRNCIDNSLKYGGDKLSEVELGCQETSSHYILFVRDDGVGLEQEDSKGIFGMFKRKKTSSGVEGCGLGLAIVKEIAAQHGGAVWFETDWKQGGITFFVSFAKSLLRE